MTRSRWLLAAVFLLALATPARADNRIVVRSTLGLQGLRNLCLLQNCTVVGGLGDPLNQLFLVTTPLDPTIFLNLIRSLPGVVDAELDQLISLIAGLNTATTAPAALSDNKLVPYFNSMVWNGYANQPAAQIVRVSTAQTQFAVAGAGIVSDIDTGVDPNHPAFTGVLLPGYDFTRNQAGASELNDFPSNPPPCPSPCAGGVVNQSTIAILDQSTIAILDKDPRYAAFGHGTMVLGVIHLVAPKATLLPLKAFGSNGTGNLSDILRAIYYAVSNGANVINMSFDIPSSSAELASALSYASQSALICAASAGNDGQKEIVYPAALQNFVMGVASTSDLDTRSSFSNYGNAIVWVAAPGEAIVTTYPFSTYAAGWGTSFSAPFVSGGSALLLNKQAKTNESQAATAVAHAVPVGADMGNGRLDLVQALQALSPQDFTLSAAPASSTINAGQSTTYTVTLTPTSGFNQTVTLTCGGFPSASTCVITPPAVTLDGTNPATATVVVQTTARAVVPHAIPRRISPLSSPVAVWLVSLLFLIVWLFHSTFHRFGQGFRQRPAFAAAAGVLAVLLCSYSCGGGSGYTGAPPSTPPPQSSATLASLTLNPTSVNGGSPSTGQVTLSGAAPSGGTVVSLSSSNTSAATVPSSVTIIAGATSATFQVATMASANSMMVTISASSSGLTQTASLTVAPQPAPGPALASLTLNPTSVNGGSPSTGQVALSGPAPSGGTVVSLASSNTSVATVPSSVTIAAGATSAAFQVATIASANSTAVTISASSGGLTQTASLTVTPQPAAGPSLTSLSLTPSSVVGGSPSSGLVTLSAPAPTGGATVSLSSSNTAVVTVPANVTVPAGATSASFTATTSSVTASSTVTVAGSYAGTTQNGSLTVTPPLPPGTPAGTYSLVITGTSGNLSHNTSVTLAVN